MSANPTVYRSAFEIAKLCRAGEWSPEQASKVFLDAAEQANSALNAFIECDPAKIRRLSGRGRRLEGVPVALKDNLCVHGWETTCSSKILKNFVSPYDATVVRRLLEEGATLLARANMDEFAFGSSCETSCYGPTRNPWDFSRVPGGSSGGSAACVAAGMASAALGSDTGGSIRQPAAFCGVVGLKPTYGRVSRYGLIAFASSLDQIGPLTQDVRDAALLLSVIAGHDPKDSTCADLPVPDYLKVLAKPIDGLRIGLPREYFIEGLDPQVRGALESAVKVFEKLGAKIVTMSLPHTRYAVSVYYLIAPSEASSNLARFDGVRFGHRSGAGTDLIDMVERTRQEGFGSEAKRRILLGTFSLSSGYYDAYYLRAMKVRTRVKNDFDRAFKDVDVILTPTTPTTAFKIGEKSADPLQMYLSDIFTIPANLAGLPGISIPCGFSTSNLPIGMQLIAKPFDEETLLRAAHAFEQNTDFHKRRPRQ